MNIHPPSTNHHGIKRSAAFLFLILFSTLAASGQTPPPNDNYSNSITLTGTDITFSGTLAGATIEDSQETNAPSDVLFVLCTQSVWWNWTAPDDTMLTLDIVNISDYSQPFSYPDALCVYSATNGSSSPAGLVLPALGAMLTLFQGSPPTPSPLSISMPVTGGSNYQIQLAGSSSANYTIRLQATKTPAIITQPRSQTVCSNAAATFYVVYAGVGQSNFTFQWYLNGTNLPGETTPILALTNIDSSMVGTYTVSVSNAAGANLSAPATLTVSQSNFPVTLAAAGVLSNSFMFSLTGEVGRSYELQSSTNLVDWFLERGFGGNPYYNVFFDTNSPQIVTAPGLPQIVPPPDVPASEYYRVTPYVIGLPDAEICINNLRQIRIAKLLWQRDYNAYLTASPGDSDLAVYLPHHTLPFCPDDTQQTFDTSYGVQSLLQTDPVCYINPTNHILNEGR